jgi:transposase
VELFERIRRDRRLDPEVSQRELARRYGVHRRTVRAALQAAVPPPRKKPSKSRALVLEPVMDWIDAMLREDLNAPRKQRHTARRIYDRLQVEYDFNVACYSTVCKYVNRRRPEILAEAREGRVHLEGTVPQVHDPGAEAEVDFADVWVRLAGEPVQCHLFTLRLSYSGKAVHRVYVSESQEAFMQGHVEAFRVLGGVPTRHIRYDNLKPAVNRVCFGRTRVESQRWTAFRSFYGFDPFYCIPGQEGAHEKGGVEHEGGRFRRTHLVPVPEVDTIEELNERLAAIDKAEDKRHIHGANTSVGFNFAAEAELLAPLPTDDFECGITLTPKVRRDARIVVRQSYYSVPARFIGRQVRVSLRANELLVFDRNQVVARHPRLTRRYAYRDDLDHYLEILMVKPGALAGCTGLAQARALIEVLLLHRRMPHEAVLAGITSALHAGSSSPELVAIEARKFERPAQTLLDDEDLAELVASGPDGQSGTGRSSNTNVITLPRRNPVLDDTRPLPSVAVYDQLLRLQSSKGTA